MNEVEKMYKLANVAKPVIKKWYYDGYYEDFSWQSSEEDCKKLLKYFDNSIDKLNDRIQQMKKEENTKYDRYTDSVDTEFGRIEKAYIDYPPFTAKKQLELIKLLQRKNGYKFSPSSTNDNSEYLFFAHKDNTSVQDLIVAGDKCYEEALAGFINTLWQDLTEEEKQQVKGILK